MSVILWLLIGAGVGGGCAWGTYDKCRRDRLPRPWAAAVAAAWPAMLALLVTMILIDKVDD